MQLPDKLTPEQNAALVECLRLLAAHGRIIRLQREAQQKATSAEALGSDAADVASESTTHDTVVIYESDYIKT